MNMIEHWATTEVGAYQHAPNYGLCGAIDYMGMNKGNNSVLIALVMQKMSFDLKEKAQVVKRCSVQGDFLVFDIVYGGAVWVKVFEALTPKKKYI